MGKKKDLYNIILGSHLLLDVNLNFWNSYSLNPEVLDILIYVTSMAPYLCQGVGKLCFTEVYETMLQGTHYRSAKKIGWKAPAVECDRLLNDVSDN